MNGLELPFSYNNLFNQKYLNNGILKIKYNLDNNKV